MCRNFSSCGNSDEIDSSQKETTEITGQAVSGTDDSDVMSGADADGSLDDSQNEVPSDITPAMWLGTSPEGNTMVCLGSMHALTDAGLSSLPEKITNAFDNADILAGRM